MLQSSEAAAIDMLNECPVTALDDGAWEDFLTAVYARVKLDPAVKARYPPPRRWDRQGRRS